MIADCIFTVVFSLFFRGFSNIELVENPRTRERLALKRMVCHSTEDQIQAQKEVEIHGRLDHPAIIK